MLTKPEAPPHTHATGCHPRPTPRAAGTERLGAWGEVRYFLQRSVCTHHLPKPGNYTREMNTQSHQHSCANVYHGPKLGTTQTSSNRRATGGSTLPRDTRPPFTSHQHTQHRGCSLNTRRARSQLHSGTRCDSFSTTLSNRRKRIFAARGAQWVPGGRGISGRGLTAKGHERALRASECPTPSSL